MVIKQRQAFYFYLQRVLKKPKPLVSDTIERQFTFLKLWNTSRKGVHSQKTLKIANKVYQNIETFMYVDSVLSIVSAVDSRPFIC